MPSKARLSEKRAVSLLVRLTESSSSEERGQAKNTTKTGTLLDMPMLKNTIVIEVEGRVHYSTEEYLGKTRGRP